MLVSNTVRLLAEATIAARDNLSPRQRLLLELFRLMPLYTQIKDLNAWHTTCRDAFGKEDDASDIGLIIQMLWDFAGWNFYAAFDPVGTAGEYATICQSLYDAGIKYPQAEEFTGL